MNLQDALASSLAASDLPAILASTVQAQQVSRGAGPTLTVEKPVLQLNLFPITLDTSLYKNALSDSNPNGDTRSLFAFRQLVDPVPSFSPYYAPVGASTEAIYGQILNGATAGDNAFTQQLIATAQQRFQEKTFADMDGLPGVWRPVYAVPGDWYDTSQVDRFRDLDLDLTAQGGPDSPFAKIGNTVELGLSIGDAPSATPLDSGTTIRSVHMKYLFVQFRRPWLNPLLFESDGWFLSGQPKGFCSSGKLDDNEGAIPLLPTGMLVAREVSVDAQWSARDRGVLNAAASSGKSVHLGPFSLGTTASTSTLQVIGWLSSLVPFSPKGSDLRPGSIVVTNKGVFTARFSVSWQQASQAVTKQSGSLLALAAGNIDIPVGATNVLIKVDIMTAPWPAETWRTVATYDCDTPVKRCYEVSGTTWSPVIKEIDCP